MDERDRSYNSRLNDLRSEIQEGIDPVAQRRYVEFHSESELRDFGRELIAEEKQRLASERGLKPSLV